MELLARAPKRLTARAALAALVSSSACSLPGAAGAASDLSTPEVADRAAALLRSQRAARSSGSPRGPTRCAPRTTRGPKLRPVAYTKGDGPLAGELLPARQGGRPGARGRPQRRDPRAVDRAAGGLDDGARVRGAPSAASSTRRTCGSRCACCSWRRSSTRAARCGCCTWTCSCCSRSGSRTCSSTAARSRRRCRSSIRCCSTCSAARCSPGCGRGSASGRSCRCCRSRSWSSAIVFLAAFRVGLNVADSNVIDVGYAGVIGADRIADGERALRRRLLARRRSAATPTGRSTTSLYVPFEQAMPWGGEVGRAAGRARGGDRVRPAHAARAGPARRAPARRAPRGGRSGSALAYAWVAVPVHGVRAGDELQRLPGRALLRGRAAGVHARARAGDRQRPCCAGVAIALGAASKFAPLALAPLFAFAGRRNRVRSAARVRARPRGRAGGHGRSRSCPTVACARSTTAPSATRRAALAVQHLGPVAVAATGCRRRQGRRRRARPARGVRAARGGSRAGWRRSAPPC